MNKLLLPFLLLTLTCQGQDTKRFKAYNGIEFEYSLLFPKNYSTSTQYQLAVVFTEVEKLDNVYLETIAGLSKQEFSNTIFIIPKVPLGEPHWKSHPIHHALNALMDQVNTGYGKKGQKFHFVGYKAGCNVAQTYASMSFQYVASLSLVHSTYWSKNKQEYFDNIADKNAPIFIYETLDQEAIKINLSKTTFIQEEDWLKAFKMIDNRLLQ
jgi:hypothetical protein